MSADRIVFNDDGRLSVPETPVITYIEGDGIGREVFGAARSVIDAAIHAAYMGGRKISWLEVTAGEKSFRQNGQWLPKETLETIRKYAVAVKGPLATPVGKGIRSINVQLRQQLDLYANIRPIRHINAVPSPVKNPHLVDIVIFRENTEDVYAGIEWAAGSDAVNDLISFIEQKTGILLPPDSGIGIKPMSEKKTKRLVAKAVSYAIENNRPSVTLMHKGNIMKYTEGAFRIWGYEVAGALFPDQTLTEDELYGRFKGEHPEGKVVIKDRIADNMFQEVLLRPENYHVIAAPNLNGDYLSDALAAQVGGLGIAPGANIGDQYAVFEAVHGTAPLLAGKDMANPLSLILSGSMMLNFIGWKEASEIITRAVETAVKNGRVTNDLAAQMEGVQEVKCSEFAEKTVKLINSF